MLKRIQFIDVDEALTCSCHVLGSSATSSSVHSVECISRACVTNIQARVPLHSRNNFCRLRVPTAFSHERHAKLTSDTRLT